MIFKKIPILFLLILLALPIIYAGNTNEGIYGVGLYGANDTDRDMIPDYADNLLYNSTYVTTTGVTTLNITTGGNHSHYSFNDTQETIFYDQANVMVNFTHNFSKSILDLSKVEIQKAPTYIIVNFSGQLENNKTLYLADDSFVSLCVKNKEISSISEMSSDCTGDNETDFTTCLGNTGVTLNGINCTDEGTRIRVENLQYSAIRGTTSAVTPPSTPPSGGGGGGASMLECYSSANCAEDRYCFENKCHDAECVDDSVCKTEEGERCLDGRCVKLFDIEILEFESPVKLGEFFDFTYFMKGMAEINGDVEINFWIERDGTIVTSGSDIIYMGNFEEKTKTKNLFLPEDIASGTYEFIIQLKFEKYIVDAHRTIGITVDDGVAEIKLISKIKFRDIATYAIVGILIIAIFIIILRKIKKKKKKSKKKIKKKKSKKIFKPIFKKERKEKTYGSYKRRVGKAIERNKK
jgi:hypothetical protein